MIKEAKRNALDVLSGNWGDAILLFILMELITLFLSIVGSFIGTAGSLIGSLITILFSNVILMGLYTALLSARKKYYYQIEYLFYHFKEDLPKKIWLGILKNLYIALWSILLIIPGIIKTYSYMLTEFICMKNPNLKADECITASKRLMDGHKMELFKLDLSFIGWILLSLLTLGIGLLWVIPYMYQTRIEYIAKNLYPYFDDENSNQADEEIEEEYICVKEEK